MNQIVEARVVASSGSTYTVNLILHQRNGPSVNLSNELVNTSLAKSPKQVSSPPLKKETGMAPVKSPHQATSPREQQARKEAQGLRSKPDIVSPKQTLSVPEAAGGGEKITIPPASPPDGTFKAKVVMVYYPTDFYLGLQYASDEHMAAMQKLKDELVQHYSSAPKTNCRPEVGDFVVANRKGFWGRARVFDIKERPKLLFVDYGMREFVDWDDIRELEERFAQVPMMALHCGIFDISSPSGNRMWPRETIQIVKEKVESLFLFLDVYTVKKN